MQKIYIFGAHSRGQTLAVYLQYLYSDLEVEAYLYDNKEQNPERIGNIPVIQVSKDTTLHIEYPVYIGTKGIYHQRLSGLMEEMGFQEIYPVTVEMDLQLRNAYVEKYFTGIGREFVKIDKLKEKTGVLRGNQRKKIYVVKSAFDRQLEQEYQPASYEREIFAGVELAGGAWPSGILKDNEGENISAKNRQYCELTALYWIWKHAEEDIIGLAHYRRHFILPPNWMEIMEDNGIDAVLPVPLFVLPDIGENYKKRHDAKEWNFLMEHLKEKSLPLYENAQKFFSGNLYSPCNMFIMRKEVLEGFCEWLFPILDAVTEYTGEKEDGYLNRYPGFLSERLLTFYFETYRHKYKVIYADKNFLK